MQKGKEENWAFRLLIHSSPHRIKIRLCFCLPLRRFWCEITQKATCQGSAGEQLGAAENCVQGFKTKDRYWLPSFPFPLPLKLDASIISGGNNTGRESMTTPLLFALSFLICVSPSNQCLDNFPQESIVRKCTGMMTALAANFSNVLKRKSLIKLWCKPSFSSTPRCHFRAKAYFPEMWCDFSSSMYCSGWRLFGESPPDIVAWWH